MGYLKIHYSHICINIDFDALCVLICKRKMWLYKGRQNALHIWIHCLSIIKHKLLIYLNLLNIFFISIYLLALSETAATKNVWEKLWPRQFFLFCFGNECVIHTKLMIISLKTLLLFLWESDDLIGSKELFICIYIPWSISG